MELFEIAESVANNVVSNDVSTQATRSASPIDTIARLERSRIEWEAGAYRTSNMQLYQILSECYAFGDELSFAESVARKQALDKFYAERGYRIKNDTPLYTRIVRAVFGNIDRRRTSTYSLVLRAAKAEQVLPLKLAEWIEANGGVQEIKLRRSANYVAPKQKVEAAQQSFSTLPILATVHSEQLSLLADADFMGEECVLLATQQADGKFAVRALLRKNAAVNAAFQSLYSEQCEKQKQQEKELLAANEADGAMKAAA